MTRIRILACILIVLIGAYATMAYAKSVRGKVEYYDRQTFKKEIKMDQKVTYGENADVTSTKDINPRNWMTNSELALWSGGTAWANGGLASVPDGWYIPSTSSLTGVTRVDVDTIAPVSSVTPSFVHSMYVSTWASYVEGPGVTKFLLYPDSGVSVAPWWIKKFAGKNVTFGAWVNRDNSAAVATGVTTNFIRPIINSHNVHLSGATSAYWEVGDFVEDSGWALSTVSWDVPADALAFEVGFAMNPTAIADKASTTSGDSAYVVAPFILINPLHKKYVPVPKETIWFDTVIGFDLNGPTYDLTAGTDSFDIELRTAGRIPPDMDSVYVVFQGEFNTANHQSQFRPDTTRLTGATLYSSAPTGVTLYSHSQWVQNDSAGDFDLYTSAAVTGVSLFILAGQMR